MGSPCCIIPPDRLRPYLTDALKRCIAKEEDGFRKKAGGLHHESGVEIKLRMSALLVRFAQIPYVAIPAHEFLKASAVARQSHRTARATTCSELIVKPRSSSSVSLETNRQLEEKEDRLEPSAGTLYAIRTRRRHSARSGALSPRTLFTGSNTRNLFALAASGSKRGGLEGRGFANWTQTVPKLWKSTNWRRR